MAKRNYPAEYARRLAKGRAEGKSRQAARGHAPPPGKREAEARRERERREAEAAHRLTRTEARAVNKTLDALAARTGIDADEIRDAVLDWAAEVGYERFKVEAAFIRRVGQQGMTWAEIERRVASGQGMPDPRLYYYRRADLMVRPYTPRSQARKDARRAADRRANRRAKVRTAAKRRRRRASR